MRMAFHLGLLVMEAFRWSGQRSRVTDVMSEPLQMALFQAYSRPCVKYRARFRVPPGVQWARIYFAVLMPPANILGMMLALGAACDESTLS